MANNATFWRLARTAVTTVLYAGTGALMGYTLGLTAFFAGARFLSASESAVKVLSYAPLGGATIGALIMAGAFLWSADRG